MRLLSGDSARADVGVQAYRERFAALGMFENAVYEGIPEVLESLQASGAQLYVATSKPQVFADRILARYFRAAFGSHLSGALSDKGELIGHVLESAYLLPGDTTMVGDREHDIRGARLNGVLAIGVLWGYGSREELIAAGAEHLLEQPRDLGRLASSEGLSSAAAGRNEG